MAESMNGLKRTHYCGEVTQEGQEVVVGGFVDRIRDKGGVIFIVLRDRTGVVQLTFSDKSDPAVFEKASTCKSEYVLMAKGMVQERESKNDKLKTSHV
ncbi:MAG TPA: OB-fold nucleic acid binding domain-containing protein, partial [Ruminococcus flavefaciens]|nr:OB-fold nucleic acid binding domain-containing protein [Ruminococcus flavefaciens]